MEDPTLTVAQVAAIYPRLAGASLEVERDDAPSIGADCEDGDPIPGARSSLASYDLGEPDDLEAYEKTPLVGAGAIRFRSARDASSYVADFVAAARSCFAFDGERSTVRRIRFGLGDERAGYEVTTRIMRQQVVSQVLLARRGKVLALAAVSSFGGRTPTVGQAVRLTALALRSAR